MSHVWRLRLEATGASSGGLRKELSEASEGGDLGVMDVLCGCGYRHMKMSGYIWIYLADFEY